jgi:integrase
MNVATMCRLFLAEQRQMLAERDPGALAPRTLADYTEALERRIIPTFGTMRVTAFKPTHAAQYLFKARRERRAVRGNREIAALASAFNHGMALGAVAANPCRGVRRNRERPRTRAVSIGELNQLLEIAQARGGAAHMVALIALMVALTGRRRAEVRELRCESVTYDGVAVIDAKNRAGRRYLIRWSPLLKRVVEDAGKVRPSATYVFPTRTGCPYTDSGFKTEWNKLMGVYQQQTGERFRAHDLRALYVSEMLARGADPATHANTATMRKVYDRRRVIEVQPLA